MREKEIKGAFEDIVKGKDKGLIRERTRVLRNKRQRHLER